MRLQKYLAQCGVASRRQAEKLIEQGRVKVNGTVIDSMGFQVNLAIDKIELDGEYLELSRPGLVLLHKPKQVITTCEDTHGRKTVRDLMPQEYQSYFPVGRLDIDTTGLVIMTNDGELADILTHPRYEIERTYIAKVQDRVGTDLVEQLAHGITLEDGFVSARVNILVASQQASQLKIVLHVGKKHIVRRMLAHLGHPVLELSRTEHGPFKLGNLASGQIKVFSDAEYRRVRANLLVD